MTRSGQADSTKVKRARRRGAVLVEAALVLPLCMLFILGMFEYARYVMFVQLVNNAAREGVRYAVAHGQPVTIAGTTYGNSTSDVTNIVNQYLGGQSLIGQQVQVYLSDAVGQNIGNWNDAQSGENICVRISGDYGLMTARLLMAPATFPVQSQAVMRIENN